MYVCGPTVYDLAHIGNARPIVVFDVLSRLLRHMKYDLTYVRNITDIDDKIIQTARKKDISIKTLTDITTKAFHQDIEKLICLPPDFEPKATEHIEDMISMIEILIGKNHAYERNGTVYFDISSAEDHGTLSGRKHDENAKSRLEESKSKMNPEDFVLWKPSSDDMPGWESPWGYGRPGWHIECSAMIWKILGEKIDIHGGGSDLIFPHHENELSQSTCTHGSELSKYWMHNAFVTVEGKKMAKSSGNFLTIRELLEKHDGEVLRYNLLQVHYRNPLNWNEASLTKAKSDLDRLYTALGNHTTKGMVSEKVLVALEDDLDTPLALSVLLSLANDINKETAEENKKRLKGILLSSANLLGLLTKGFEGYFHQNVDEKYVEGKIAERTLAKQQKDFDKADQIRQSLLDDGIILEDTVSGTIWKR